MLFNTRIITNYLWWIHSLYSISLQIWKDTKFIKMNITLFYLNIQQFLLRLHLQMYVEWSRTLELIKRLYQFQKLMPHINYFRSLCVSLYLQSFLSPFLYLETKCFVCSRIINIFFFFGNILFYQQVYHIKFLVNMNITRNNSWYLIQVIF